MTTAEIKTLLSTYNPDHYPEISFSNRTNWEEHFYLNMISIVKFPPAYYNGDWECFCPSLFEDVYRSPTLAGIIDFVLAIHPNLLYSKTNHPELFL